MHMQDPTSGLHLMIACRTYFSTTSVGFAISVFTCTSHACTNLEEQTTVPFACLPLKPNAICTVIADISSVACTAGL